jgi:hypothetical protein
MAPVAVTSYGATTSSSDGGGVCVCCWDTSAVVVREVVGQDDVMGVGIMAVSAQTQYVPYLQKPQLSLISTDITGRSCCCSGSEVISIAGVVVVCSACFFCWENMVVKSISKGPASER